MSFFLSRLMSSATATYAGYCFVEPRHLGRALTSRSSDQAGYDVLAYTYGARDLAISSVGLFGRSEKAVTTAMTLRILIDVSDGLVLAAKAEDDDVRGKVLGVTLGWAALNTLALTLDRRRARKGRRITV